MGKNCQSTRRTIQRHVTMAIIATDILIKSMLEAAIADYRANSWIVEDVFSGLASDPLAAPEAGWKEVKTAMNWFQRTDIPVLLQHRIGDAPKIPCISIAYQPSREMQERASLGDDGIVEDYTSHGNGEIIAVQKITRNFTPSEYDKSEGLFTMPKGVSTEVMSSGNYVVAKSGKAYEITRIVGTKQFNVAPGTIDDFTDCYIAPKSTVWNVHREITFLSESYQIGCHTQNDPSTTIWLWQLVFYSFLRYKEAFLEGRGFELSGLQSSALERNQQFEAENVFSKYITISGQTCGTWIKFIAPKLESVTGGIKILDASTAIDLDTTYGDNSEDCPPTWWVKGDFEEEENPPVLGEDDKDC